MDTETKWFLWNISKQLEILNAKNDSEEEHFINRQYVQCEPEHSVFNKKTNYMKILTELKQFEKGYMEFDNEVYDIMASKILKTKLNETGRRRLLDMLDRIAKKKLPGFDEDK